MPEINIHAEDQDDDEQPDFAPAFRLTARGFGLYEFEDLYGKPCSLQDSSLAEEAAIWLGQGDDRMHLSFEQAAWLAQRLIEFLRDGDLRTAQRRLARPGEGAEG